MTTTKQAPTFASPLPRSPESSVLEWRFPKPNDHLVLTGTSRAAWHTSFVISQLNLLLDAGLCVNKQRPRHIFLTHGHSDHTLLAPAFVKRNDPDPPNICCPVEMADALDAFLHSKTMLDLGGLVRNEEARGVDGKGLDTHSIQGVRAGDTVPLRRKAGWSAAVVACDHSVPCVGYVFSHTTTRLRPEYAGLSQAELAVLRKNGAELSMPVSKRVFAFLGDTTVSTLANTPSWLEEGIPVVITECSFLQDKHRAQAEQTKHTLWSDLEKVVRRWQSTTFILTHFSLRYSDDDVRTFFTEMDDPPRNIIVWIS
jgi:ribonuclease Z